MHWHQRWRRACYIHVIVSRVTGKQEVIPGNPNGNRRLALVVQKGLCAAAAKLLLSTPTFCFSAGQPAYLCDSLLIDMTADETTRRGAGFTRSDQIGKVFLVVGQDVRKCLVCEQQFTRQAFAEHAKRACYPARS
jgi:hypothetical protein